MASIRIDMHHVNSIDTDSNGRTIINLINNQMIILDITYAILIEFDMNSQCEYLTIAQ